MNSELASATNSNSLQDTSAPTTTLPPAGLIRRLMSLVYDFFLLLGITFAYGVLLVLIRHALNIDPLEPFGLLVNLLILLGLWGCCSIFYCWCWIKSGQTLGMKSWRIRLKNTQNQKLGWRQCWLRCVVATLLNTCFGIGLLWCLVDRQKRSAQDIITGTQVELLPKESGN